MLTVRVVKIGGNQLDRPVWVAECARALRGAGPVVVVHGGGQAVSAWSRRLGLPVEKRDGLRVTTPEIAQIVEMVLGGPMNRLLVSALRDAGLDAIGLSGVDGGLLTAQPVQNESELGEVGTIENVRASLLQSLLLAGKTPGNLVEELCGVTGPLESYLDWKTALRMFVARARAPVHTYARPSRRLAVTLRWKPAGATWNTPGVGVAPCSASATAAPVARPIQSTKPSTKGSPPRCMRTATTI